MPFQYQHSNFELSSGCMYALNSYLFRTTPIMFRMHVPFGFVFFSERALNIAHLQNLGIFVMVFCSVCSSISFFMIKNHLLCVDSAVKFGVPQYISFAVVYLSYCKHSSAITDAYGFIYEFSIPEESQNR